MKKTKILAALLAFLLTFQIFSLPVLASEAQTQEPSSLPSETAAETVPAVTTEPQGETGSGATDPAPAESDSYSGEEDSDIGIDAPQALTGTDTLDFDAAAVLLLELNSQTMVYAKNIDAQREPASLTKIMTCLLALEHGNLSDEITVSETALEGLDPAGSSSGLLAGEVFTLEQLLYCLMIESANDAAPVIAEYIAGSEALFVDMMNAKANELGCENTHFANTHGLHDDAHYTTARDLAKITMAALHYEKFQEIYSTDRYILPATNLHEERILVTTNYLIGTSITQEYYDVRGIGGKTGFTTPAGRCIMCVAEEQDMQYLCIVLGADSTGADGSTVYGSFLVAGEALDFGFDHFTFVEVLSPLAPVAQLPVAQATQSVVVTPAEPISTMLPTDYEEDQLTTQYQLSSQTGLEAPLESGQVVGVVQKYYGSVCVGQTDLVTVTAVSRNALAAAAMQTVDQISQSPWRFVILILAVLLGVVLILFVWSAVVRHRRKKRRQMRRRRN